jgi:membrane protease YdiL (CAAX protease family)
MDSFGDRLSRLAMAAITEQGVPKSEATARLSGKETEGRPTRLSPACIVVYLAVHEVLRQLPLAGFPYSLVLLRLLFLGGVAVVLWRRHDLRSFFGYVIGRVRLSWSGVLLAAVMLVMTVAARMAIECFQPCVKLDLNTRAFVDAVLIAPINEEIVFRGVFLGVLLGQPGWGKTTAVLVTALVFAGTHQIEGVTGLLRLMTLGVVTGLAYVATRSVPVCMLSHMTWNLAAFCPFIHPGKPGEMWFFYMQQ